MFLIRAPNFILSCKFVTRQAAHVPSHIAEPPTSESHPFPPSSSDLYPIPPHPGAPLSMASEASQVEIQPTGQPPPPAQGAQKLHEAPPPQQQQSETPQRSTKRQKVTRACDNCKSRKRRCTGELPCSLCWYVLPIVWPVAVVVMCGLMAGVVSLSRGIYALWARLITIAGANGAECTYNATYTRGKLVQPVPASRGGATLATSPSVAAKPSQSIGIIQARAVADGAEGLNSNNRSSGPGSPEGETATLAGQYSGPTSAYSFLRRAWRRFGLNVNQEEEKESSQAVPIFSYGDKQLPRSGDGITNFSLPDKSTTDELFALYFDFAMPTYRFLHQPTAYSWLQSYHDQFETGRVVLLPARQAVVLMILATSALLKADTDPGLFRWKEEAWHHSEPYFQAAQMKLASETGKVRLESVQARLAVCLYLMHTSRPNQAWYTFGITCQILTALGMHRAGGATTSQLDTITIECRKRAFWSAFSLDTYLSVIIGRPTLLHSDDADQKFPEAVDDDEITANAVVRGTWQKDPVMQGAIFHAKITRISKTAIKEQYSVHRHKDAQRLNVAAKLNAEVAEWRKTLPVVLSGAIHPSSLIQIFQRQIIVLELAHSLAVILINRPLLLIDSNVDNKSNVNACLSAAKSILDTVTGFITNTRTFPSFWFTQNVTFNALSVVYVWLIQRKRGRMAGHNPPHSDDELYQLAETIQKHLRKATVTNAPSLRYSIILEELQQEATRLWQKSNKARPPNLSGLIDPPPTEAHPYATPANASESSPTSNRAMSNSWDTLSGDFPLDPDIWLQLDSFPFRKF